MRSSLYWNEQRRYWDRALCEMYDGLAATGTPVVLPSLSIPAFATQALAPGNRRTRMLMALRAVGLLLADMAPFPNLIAFIVALGA